MLFAYSSAVTVGPSPGSGPAPQPARNSGAATGAAAALPRRRRRVMVLGFVRLVMAVDLPLAVGFAFYRRPGTNLSAGTVTPAGCAQSHAAQFSRWSPERSGFVSAPEPGTTGRKDVTAGRGILMPRAASRGGSDRGPGTFRGPRRARHCDSLFPARQPAGRARPPALSDLRHHRSLAAGGRSAVGQTHRRRTGRG